MLLNLQLFAGSLTVTVNKDAHMTTASASPSSSLAKDDKVTLTLTPASGYEVAEIEVIAGGISHIYQGETVWFEMGEADVELYVKSQANNKYKIVENCYVAVNGSVTRLQKNMQFVYGKTGAVIDVDSTPTAITLSADLIENLLESGVIVKDSPAWSGEEEPAES